MSGSDQIGLQLGSVRLEPGAHDSPDDGVCIVELASMLAGEEFSDDPECVDEVIASFLRSWNDRASYSDRQRLLPYAERVVGTRADAATTPAARCLPRLGRDRGQRGGPAARPGPDRDPCRAAPGSAPQPGRRRVRGAARLRPRRLRKPPSGSSTSCSRSAPSQSRPRSRRRSPPAPATAAPRRESGIFGRADAAAQRRRRQDHPARGALRPGRRPAASSTATSLAPAAASRP